MGPVMPAGPGVPQLPDQRPPSGDGRLGGHAGGPEQGLRPLRRRWFRETRRWPPASRRWESPLGCPRPWLTRRAPRPLRPSGPRPPVLPPQHEASRQPRLRRWALQRRAPRRRALRRPSLLPAQPWRSQPGEPQPRARPSRLRAGRSRAGRSRLRAGRSRLRAGRSPAGRSRTGLPWLRRRRPFRQQRYWPQRPGPERLPAWRPWPWPLGLWRPWAGCHWAGHPWAGCP